VCLPGSNYQQQLTGGGEWEEGKCRGQLPTFAFRVGVQMVTMSRQRRLHFQVTNICTLSNILLQ
jgi:hypothetical protein